MNLPPTGLNQGKFWGVVPLTDNAIRQADTSLHIRKNQNLYSVTPSLSLPFFLFFLHWEKGTVIFLGFLYLFGGCS